MLFKFASYLLGTNNESEGATKIEQPADTENSENIQNTQPSLQENSSTSSDGKDEAKLLTDDKPSIDDIESHDLIEEDDYMYDEQLINCSKTKNSNSDSAEDSTKDDHLCDQLEDDDSDEDQWIYITPIKRKNADDKETSVEEDCVSDTGDESSLLADSEDEVTSNANVPRESAELESSSTGKEIVEKFNFYDYFNNKGDSKVVKNGQECVPKSPSLKKIINSKNQQLNCMDQSWVIHPPACFQFENTFAIEEHPLENLYIENPAISVIASCKSINKENTSTLTSKSTPSINTNRVLTTINNQAKEKTSVTSRKSMRKRANSTRKSGKKQAVANGQTNKKSKKQSSASPITEDPSAADQNSKDTITKNDNVQQRQQDLRERDEKKNLAHYLIMCPTVSNTIASSSLFTTNTANVSGSTHASTNNHQNHPHSHHYTSNHFVATHSSAGANASSELKKGSKSLRRNNKVALKRDNLSNKPFTLHRKLC